MWSLSQFKTYEFFISRILHLIFSEHSPPWVSEISDNSDNESAQV